MRRAKRFTKKERMTLKRATPGSGDDLDPLKLINETTNDQMEEQLDTCVKSLFERDAWGREIYTDWERGFITNVHEIYASRCRRGYSDRPLSGKQLVVLKQLWKRLAVDAAAMLARMG